MTKIPQDKSLPDQSKTSSKFRGVRPSIISNSLLGNPDSFSRHYDKYTLNKENECRSITIPSHSKENQSCRFQTKVEDGALLGSIAGAVIGVITHVYLPCLLLGAVIGASALFTKEKCTKESETAPDKADETTRLLVEE